MDSIMRLWEREIANRPELFIICAIYRYKILLY
jgi:hypothetical protein